MIRCVTIGTNSHGFRSSIHLEARIIHDATKPLLDLSSWSGALTLSTTSFEGRNTPDKQGAYGAEIDFGADFLITNANHINEVLGNNVNSGMSGGLGLGWDFEIAGMLDPCGNNIVGDDGFPVMEGSFGLPLTGQNIGIAGHEGINGKTYPLLGFGE